MQSPVEISRFRRSVRNSLSFATLVGCLGMAVESRQTFVMHSPYDTTFATLHEYLAIGSMLAVVLLVGLASSAVLYARTERRRFARFGIGFQLALAATASFLLQHQWTSVLLVASSVFAFERLSHWQD